MRNNFTRIIAVAIVTFVVTSFQNCAKNFKTLTPDKFKLNSVAAINKVPEVDLVNALPTVSNLKSRTVMLKTSIDPRLTVKSVTCQIDTAPAADCSGLSLALNNLADGDHQIKLDIQDSSGQRGVQKIIV
ncbi:MAG: hypothetical protein V4736_04835, partial [Bdellovibrionota bacterium]